MNEEELHDIIAESCLGGVLSVFFSNMLRCYYSKCICIYIHYIYNIYIYIYLYLIYIIYNIYIYIYTIYIIYRLYI